MTTEYRNIQGNRKHKDGLFRLVFKEKKYLLELYNAINGTNHTNEDDLEEYTLENVLYITMKNDIAFLIDCTLNLYEHQSSDNANMPLRGLLYLAGEYSRYVAQRKLNLFSSALQKIPTPNYVVFYNGTSKEPDKAVQRLSDAFISGKGCLEFEATVLNINYGQNRELMKKCRRLEEYAIFVSTVRQYAAEEKRELGEAICQAVEECLEKGILVDILTTQRAEVFEVILETFDREVYERDLKNEAVAAGLAEGRVKGRAEGLAEGRAALLREMILKKVEKGKSVEEIADALEISEEMAAAILEELNKG